MFIYVNKRKKPSTKTKLFDTNVIKIAATEMFKKGDANVFFFGN